MKEKKTLDLMLPPSQYFHAPAIAYLFSLLNVYVKSNNKVLEWIISNFIEICIDIKLKIPESNFAYAYEEFFRQNLWYSCPFIECVDIKPDFIKVLELDQFSDLVCKAIKEGYFVYADLNTYYIPNYCSNKNWQHNILLYGYDLKEETFQIADYFRNREFTMEKCLIKDINLAWENMDKLDGNGSERFNTVNMFKYKECSNYNFNILSLKNSLKDYLNSEDLLKKYKYAYYAYEYRDSGELYYGISYYDALLQVLKNEQWFLPKVLHFLVVHKSIMKLRIEVLIKYKIIEDLVLETMADELLNRTIILRNMLLKITQKNKNEIIKNVEEQKKLEYKIKELKELDYNFTQRLIDIL